jgi:hypothetical protein
LNQQKLIWKTLYGPGSEWHTNFVNDIRGTFMSTPLFDLVTKLKQATSFLDLSDDLPALQAGLEDVYNRLVALEEKEQK